MGLSRQEHWSGLPFPSPGDLPNPGIKPTSLMSPVLTGMSFTTSTTCKAPDLFMLCVCLVSQSCPTACNPMDCNPPGSSVHGDSPSKNTEVGCHFLLQGIFPTQGSNPGLPHYRQTLYCLSQQGSPSTYKTNNKFLNDPEGWYGEGGGREVQDGEHVYARGGFMLMCGRTNTIL